MGVVGVHEVHFIYTIYVIYSTFPTPIGCRARHAGYTGILLYFHLGIYYYIQISIFTLVMGSHHSCISRPQASHFTPLMVVPSYTNYMVLVNLSKYQ